MDEPSAMSPADPLAEHILVVDDDPGIRDVVAEFLGRHGYEVETAADGKAMERALMRRRPDLVVLDVMLPGEDGLAICRRLSRRDGPAIIMLSAMGEETDRIVGLELGADDYLPKPCNPRELLARVRAVLRRRREPRGEADSLDAACEFAGWRLDLVRHELRSPQGRGGQPVERGVLAAAGLRRAAAAGADPRPASGSGAGAAARTPSTAPSTCRSAACAASWTPGAAPN